MLRHSATEYKYGTQTYVRCLAACMLLVLFILMHFVTFTSHGSHKYLLTCGSKRAISFPTISPNLSRNAGSFFSFELLKSMVDICIVCRLLIADHKEHTIDSSPLHYKVARQSWTSNTNMWTGMEYRECVRTAQERKEWRSVVAKLLRAEDTNS